MVEGTELPTINGLSMPSGSSEKPVKPKNPLPLVLLDAEFGAVSTESVDIEVVREGILLLLLEGEVLERLVPLVDERDVAPGVGVGGP